MLFITYFFNNFKRKYYQEKKHIWKTKLQKPVGKSMSVHSIPLTFIFIKKLKHMEKCESVQNCIYNDNYTMCYRLNQFCSVTQSCPTLCNPMNCSTPGLPVHHQLLESTQTHVHPVDDAIQPSHSVVPFSPCPNPSQQQGLFQ